MRSPAAPPMGAITKMPRGRLQSRPLSGMSSSFHCVLICQTAKDVARSVSTPGHDQCGVRSRAVGPTGHDDNGRQTSPPLYEFVTLERAAAVRSLYATQVPPRQDSLFRAVESGTSVPGTIDSRPKRLRTWSSVSDN